MNLKGKHIVLGITGSIAAYKACLLIREFVKMGAEVQVVITPAGKEFVTPVTLSALSRNPVISEFFAQRDGTWHSHVDLGLWADAMVIAPCTASTLGKMANGVADNMLVTTYLSMKAPVFIAPAMDIDMYAHPSTRRNMETLRSYGNYIIEPASGFLASGLEGKGRMEEPHTIVREVAFAIVSAERQACKRLDGVKALVTAGPTREKIDPVRYLSNYSSGKMGFAIAEELARRGAEVTLVAGPVSLPTPKGVTRIDVESCEEMHNAAMASFGDAAVAVLSAAVADYRPAVVSECKIKRSGSDMQIDLAPNPDIAASLGAKKKAGQRIVAFALETDNELENARGKLLKKNADFVVLNSMRNEGTCFQSDYNKIDIVTAEGVVSYERKPKWEAAMDIVDAVTDNL